MGTARSTKRNADGEREAEVGRGRRWKSKMHGEVEWAAVQDGESSCWKAEGFGFLTTALALMAALTSIITSLVAAAHFPFCGVWGQQPAPAHSQSLPRSLVFNQRLLF